MESGEAAMLKDVQAKHDQLVIEHEGAMANLERERDKLQEENKRLLSQWKDIATHQRMMREKDVNQKDLERREAAVTAREREMEEGRQKIRGKAAETDDIVRQVNEKMQSLARSEEQHKSDKKNFKMSVEAIRLELQKERETLRQYASELQNRENLITQREGGTDLPPSSLFDDAKVKTLQKEIEDMQGEKMRLEANNQVLKEENEELRTKASGAEAVPELNAAQRDGEPQEAPSKDEDERANLKKEQALLRDERQKFRKANEELQSVKRRVMKWASSLKKEKDHLKFKAQQVSEKEKEVQSQRDEVTEKERQVQQKQSDLQTREAALAVAQITIPDTKKEEMTKQLLANMQDRETALNAKEADLRKVEQELEQGKSRRDEGWERLTKARDRLEAEQRELERARTETAQIMKKAQDAEKEHLEKARLAEEGAVQVDKDRKRLELDRQMVKKEAENLRDRAKQLASDETQELHGQLKEKATQKNKVAAELRLVREEAAKEIADLNARIGEISNREANAGSRFEAKVASLESQIKATQTKQEGVAKRLAEAVGLNENAKIGESIDAFLVASDQLVQRARKLTEEQDTLKDREESLQKEIAARGTLDAQDAEQKQTKIQIEAHQKVLNGTKATLESQKTSLELDRAQLVAQKDTMIADAQQQAIESLSNDRETLQNEKLQ